MFLLCCVALASGGAIGDRQEEEEAKADTVTVRMASWTVLWAGGQRDLGCLCPEENCVSDLYSSEPWGLWGTSLLSCNCPVLALQVHLCPCGMEGVSKRWPTRLGLAAGPWFGGLLLRVP